MESRYSCSWPLRRREYDDDDYDIMIIFFVYFCQYFFVGLGRDKKSDCQSLCPWIHCESIVFLLEHYIGLTGLP